MNTWLVACHAEQISANAARLGGEGMLVLRVCPALSLLGRKHTRPLVKGPESDMVDRILEAWIHVHPLAALAWSCTYTLEALLQHL